MDTFDVYDSETTMMTPIENAFIPEMDQNDSEKNIDNIEMDSTPLSELMNENEVMDNMQTLQNPRMMMPPPPPLQQQQQQVASKPEKAYKKPKQETQYPFNLTDEQMDSLIAGVAAIVAFSATAQDKLANFVPSSFDETGQRTTMGILFTALIAAVTYYIVKRFLVPTPKDKN